MSGKYPLPNLGDLTIMLALAAIGAAIGFGTAPLGLEAQRTALGAGIGGAALPAAFLLVLILDAL